MNDMTQDSAMSDAQAQEAVLGYLLGEESKKDEQNQDNAAPPEANPDEIGYSASIGEDGQPVEAEQAAEQQESEEQEGEEAKQESEVEAEQELSFETIDQVAEAAGMSLEDFIEKVKGTVKINGEESKVTLKEALAGYQREADYTRKTQEVAQQRQEVTKRQEQLNEMETVLQAAIMDDPYAAEEQRLAQEYQSVNWNELRENSDGSFADTQAAFQQRYQQLQFLKNQRVQRLDQARQHLFEQKVQLGREALKERLQGDLTDEDRQGVAKVLSDVGYTQGELSNFTDHRAVLLAREVLQLKSQGSAAKQAEAKRVQRRTPVLRPGATKGAAGMAQSKHKALVQRAQKTQSDEAWADVLADLGV